MRQQYEKVMFRSTGWAIAFSNPVVSQSLYAGSQGWPMGLITPSSGVQFPLPLQSTESSLTHQ